MNTIDEWRRATPAAVSLPRSSKEQFKLDDWVILAVSSEGTVRNGVGDSIKHLLSILKGEYYDPHTPIWYYRLTTSIVGSKHGVKAQPTLGRLYLTTLTEGRGESRNVPSARNAYILRNGNWNPMRGIHILLQV